MPRLGVWGSQGGSYGTSRACTRSGYGGHMQGFVLRDGGSPSRIDTHGEVPKITGVFDDSWSSIILSRTGFPTRLKCKKVGIDKEKTLRVIVKEKLSKRAVMKEDGLGRVYLQERRLTPIGT